MENLSNQYYIDRQNDFESSARSYPRKFPFALKKAKGSWVEDVEGNRYLDFLCGAGTLALGHNDEEVNQAMIDLLTSDAPLHTLDLTTPVKDRFRSLSSERRDLNPRHPPWQGGALPLSYFRINYVAHPTRNDD